MKIYNCFTANDKRQELSKKYNVNITNNLWHQPATNLYFSIDFLRRHVGKYNCIFTDSQKEFQNKYKNKILIREEEFAYQWNQRMIDFPNSKVLIVGGGPSTNTIDWDANEYDHVFSCNNCYLNEKIYNTSISLLYLNMTHDYPQKKKLNSYLNKHKPLVVYNYAQMSKNKINYSNTINTALRYNGRIGVIPYLILYCVMWKVKEVHIVGMDGLEISNNVRFHSFLNKDVKFRGSIEENSKNWQEVINAYHRQYIMFFDYVFNHLKATTKFVNLAANQSDNMLTGISKELF